MNLEGTLSWGNTRVQALSNDVSKAGRKEGNEGSGFDAERESKAML